MLILSDSIEHLYRCCCVVFLLILFMVISYSKPLNIHENYDDELSSYVFKSEILKSDRFNASVHTPLGIKSYEELESSVFRPLGYRIREPTLIPSLDFLESPNCPRVFSDWLAGSEKQNEAATPPRTMPSRLEHNYTLFGHANLLKAYSDERSGTEKMWWSKSFIDSHMRTDVEAVNNYLGEGRSIYHAMKAFDVAGKKGMVVGSLTPWVEAFALKLGAAHVTTVEYRKITIPDDNRITYFHPLDIARNAINHIDKYDFVASFSSLEHSGLGRYGDALDPFGDLKEAMKVYCILKKNGFFFIALPTGHDTLHWNLHRIYGRIRYALFAAGFEIVDAFYMHERMKLSTQIFEPIGFGSYFHPVFVLRKR